MSNSPCNLPTNDMWWLNDPVNEKPEAKEPEWWENHPQAEKPLAPSRQLEWWKSENSSTKPIADDALPPEEPDERIWERER